METGCADVQQVSVGAITLINFTQLKSKDAHKNERNTEDSYITFINYFISQIQSLFKVIFM